MNEDSLYKFNNYLDAQKVSSNTRKAYNCYVKQFLHQQDMVGKSIKDTVVDDVVIYLASLNRRNKTSSSSLMARASLKRFLDIHGVILNWSLIRLPKKKSKIKTMPSKKQFMLIVSNLPEPERTAGFIMMGGGLRIGECTNLQYKDVDAIEGKIRVIENQQSKDGILKTGERLTVLREPFKGFVLKSPLFLRTVKKNDYIFDFKDNEGKVKRLTEHRMWRKLRKSRDNLNLFVQIKPHWLRHYFGNSILWDTNNIFLAKTLMGHKSIVTTQQYMHEDEEAIQKILDEDRKRGVVN